MTLGTKFTWSTNGSSVLQLSNQLIARLPETGEALKVWNKEQFGNIHTRIADARRAIHSLVKDADEDGDQREEATQAIQIANRELHELLRQEELMWKQKSRVTWLLCLGFYETWTNWLMECVRTPTFSVLLNGGPCGKVVPQRGFRQGDPLSPYLFVLGCEVRSRILNRSCSEGLLKGIHVSKGGTELTHALFADDLIIFARANKKVAIYGD